LSYRYLKIPHLIERLEYEKTVDKMVEILKGEKSILAIYRMGNVNHPGISDLDLIVIFKDEASCNLKPSKHFSEIDQYIFTHSLAGASESFFRKMSAYTFWDKLNCIWGEEVQNLENLSAEETELIKRQTALEYLYKNYIELCIQRSYRVLKLRSILQEIKAIRYDLNFLKIDEGQLYESVKELLSMLDHWFEINFDRKKFGVWLDRYFVVLEQTLKNLADKEIKLWLPKQESYQYGKNVQIKGGDKLEFKRSGVSLPPYIVSQNKRLYNANQRLNEFSVAIPYTYGEPGSLYSDRLKVFQAYKKYNRDNIPHFEAMFSSFSNQLV